jgi:hypothetical protein
VWSSWAHGGYLKYGCTVSGGDCEGRGSSDRDCIAYRGVWVVMNKLCIQMYCTL